MNPRIKDRYVQSAIDAVTGRIQTERSGLLTSFVGVQGRTALAFEFDPERLELSLRPPGPLDPPILLALLATLGRPDPVRLTRAR
ncbi:hypothetical protein [Leptospirillum ferrooxidans]|uniref:Uncharacterized protein n=1 Tax=Leptospirillum ferrooxidans (strain C2-3) TaxID=1162668 RepID=I0IMK6_LEPFC|nr:hypothetical protein [Leptospirillum ferrooxidans]BAM06505.1 hypothetical protein LFE_0790 [Leptospirillum ferrooxidans C2-3]